MNELEAINNILDTFQRYGMTLAHIPISEMTSAEQTIARDLERKGIIRKVSSEDYDEYVMSRKTS